MGAVDADTEWARDRVESFPVSWASKLLTKWRELRGSDTFEANRKHLRSCRRIAAAHRAGLRADANDDELCTEADKSARDAIRRMEWADRISANRGWPPVVAMTKKLWLMADWLGSLGLADAWDNLQRISKHGRAVLARLASATWWRRVLRKLHARAVESTARAIGLVHKRAGCYVSAESLQRRQGQRARNAAALESVRAVNEHGQDYTLAELAAKGPANREIRRHELMTRIAGFETIAKECGHHALFVTVTCPSRMHAYRTKPKGWGVEPNPKHDGTRPDDAQTYLVGQWAKFRSACARYGVELYGFRIAEPNHDGTPHWHALLFVQPMVGAGELVSNSRAGRPVADRVALRLLRRYFLRNADVGERGARAHRVKVERIDWTRGSAAGYVAKYVAKNIDGYRVEKDLYGNDAITSSQRVEAWAATWRIRQFQQIGGAPVGVWRELRRLHPEQGGDVEAVVQGLEACNLSRSVPADAGDAVKSYSAATGWAAYTWMQGGHKVRRAELRVRLLREQTGQLGRYSELMAPRTIGVETIDVRRLQVPAFGIVPAMSMRRKVAVQVESERCDWIVVPAGFVAAARARFAPAADEVGRPWSPVNNCTRPATEQHPEPLFGHAVERVRKRGRWHHWPRPAETGTGVPKPTGDPPDESNSVHELAARQGH